MPAPALPSRPPLPALRQEIRYTLARATAAKVAPVAASFAELLDDWAAVDAAQNAAWDAVVQANAAIADVDEQLDAFIVRFHATLLDVVGGDRGASQYKVFFKQAPHKLAEPVLGDELETLRGWLKLGGKGKDPRLTARLKELGPLVAAADAAIAARHSAELDAAELRQTGAFDQFVRELVTRRNDALRQLELLSEAGKLGGRRPLGFFRGRPPKRRSDEEKEARRAAKEATTRARDERRAAVKAARAQMKAAVEALKKAKKG